MHTPISDNINGYIWDINSPIEWIFKKKRAVLKNADHTIIELKGLGRKKTTFKLGDRNFSLKNRGFWSAETVLKENSKKLAELKRSFSGNKTFVEFENGNRYSIKSRNLVLIRLSIYNENKKELITYKLVSKSKAVVFFEKNNLMDQEELLLLIVFGFFIFRGILKDNNVIDLSALSFKNKSTEKEDKIKNSAETLYNL